jgi:oxaloacetate decarboxylase alpha subunit/pyruvate carboxylase subunit B
MDKLRAELAAANLPTDDEACVLHAMFPREFSDLHKKKAAPAAAPVEIKAAPAPVAAPVAAAPAPVASSSIPGSATGRRCFAITVAGKRSEVCVEEIA